MTVQGDLRTQVLNGASVAALISDRLYDVQLPEDPTYPAMTMRRISAPRLTSHDGDSGLSFSVWQFDCWATTRAGAEALANALRQRISGFRGQLAGTGATAAILLQNEYDDIVPETDIRRVTLEFSVEYSEA